MNIRDLQGEARTRDGTVAERDKLIDFIRESNRIEGLHHEPGHTEITAYKDFLALPSINVADLERFVAVVQPGAVLRRKQGQDVRVGSHRPPRGGAKMEKWLTDILDKANAAGRFLNAYIVHCDYEGLHPFTDGNGRSGRVLWLWMMGGIEAVPLGFLHAFYYQVLDNRRTGG